MVKSRKGAGAKERPAARPTSRRTDSVGRPIQARLVSLEKHLGLFSEDRRLAADSRFNHPVLICGEDPMPDGMRASFPAELEALERLGRATDLCHHQEVAGHQVCCLSYFYYDGFKTLTYVERKGQFVAAWKDEEVLYPDSPRALMLGVDDADLEAFLAQVPD